MGKPVTVFYNILHILLNLMDLLIEKLLSILFSCSFVNVIPCPCFVRFLDLDILDLDEDSQELTVFIFFCLHRN